MATLTFVNGNLAALNPKILRPIALRPYLSISLPKSNIQFTKIELYESYNKTFRTFMPPPKGIELKFLWKFVKN
jgi:hypothetical protein